MRSPLDVKDPTDSESRFQSLHIGLLRHPSSEAYALTMKRPCQCGRLTEKEPKGFPLPQSAANRPNKDAACAERVSRIPILDRRRIGSRFDALAVYRAYDNSKPELA